MRYASGSEKSRSGEGERAQSRGVVVAGGEFVYRLGERRGQSVSVRCYARCDTPIGSGTGRARDRVSFRRVGNSVASLFLFHLFLSLSFSISPFVRTK